MVSTWHPCSYDNSTISLVNKLKTIGRFSPFFPSFTFLFFPPFLFNFFLFFKFMSKSRFIAFPGHCLTAYYFQRERERESPKSSREGSGRVVRWC